MKKILAELFPSQLTLNWYAKSLIKQVGKKLVGKGNLWAISIKEAIRNNTAAPVIIECIKNGIDANPQMVLNLLGDKLANRILDFNVND